MKTAVYAHRVLKVAKELATLAIADPDKDVRRMARRDAKALLDVARLLQWKRFKTAKNKVATSGRSAIFIPKSVKKFLEREG
jgi:hypothetical protein